MSKTILTNRSVGRQGSDKTKESTRLELAACAAQFFAEQGYHGTSTQAIAQSCRIRKASLFHHYKTKEDIALAAIQYVQKECITHIFKHADNTQLEPEQRIQHFLQACEQFFTDRMEALLPTLLGLELSNVNIFVEAISNYFQAWVDAVTRLLLPLHGNLDKAEQLAIESVTLMQGHLVIARIKQNQQQLALLSTELRQLWLTA